jgi:hypothetical protein
MNLKKVLIISIIIIVETSKAIDVENNNNYFYQQPLIFDASSTYQQQMMHQRQLPDDSIDRKYVNSGQSVLLVCDLPTTNMPDGGKVSHFIIVIIRVAAWFNDYRYFRLFVLTIKLYIIHLFI